MSTKTIAIDFDGVLADYTGWKGEDHYGEPLPDALAFVTELISAGYQVVIFTTRASGTESIKRMEGWFALYGLAEELLEQLVITCVKPPAWLYVDDRAFLFKGTYPTMGEIESFKPWWQHEQSERQSR